MSSGAKHTATLVDIGGVLDDGPFSTMQKIAVFMVATAIVMDGFDGQLIGFAIPSLIKEWGITRGAFAPAVAAGLLGMAVGSVCAGLLADRFGRRMAVIVSVFIFGATTCTIGFAPNVVTISALRFIAGLGIGGALPSSTTVTAEFTPARRRTLAVTATTVCYPLGGIIAGLFASAVLPVYGWRGLFWIGGLLPMGLSVLLFLMLPESPRYLARHRERWPELRKLLGRMARPTSPDTVFVDASEQAAEKRAGFGSLFESGRLRDTLAIWTAFFMCLLAVYSAFSWLPTMLAGEGLPPAVAASGLTAYNFGGVVGALMCAVVIARFGSRWPLAFCCAGAAGSAFMLQGVNVAQHTGWLIFGIGLHGLFVNAVQSTMYALCAYVYPTIVRATGTASALAFGRLGAILSSFAGAAVITAGGGSAFFIMLGLAMSCAFVALMAVGRHSPKVAANTAVRATAAASSH
ncbi:MFS transporter [Paraburkholderia sp. Ac-20347]|uniref:MFS transporter n=1 Tax=Paraburkholderia sp. Ac-20347 TaxID=2703892 RepID=UPI00197E1D24|nr:MFS transporter [Paraburkholderia sp. Ac-20347]MBN3809949.1 MFS transporter [Paraburkholderia sp. Ac-20347]